MEGGNLKDVGSNSGFGVGGEIGGLEKVVGGEGFKKVVGGEV